MLNVQNQINDIYIELPSERGESSEGMGVQIIRGGFENHAKVRYIRKENWKTFKRVVMESGKDRKIFVI